jgi:signal transduction histidine kinase
MIDKLKQFFSSISIRFKLIFSFTIISSGILILFSITLISSYSSYRELSYFSRLKENSDNLLSILLEKKYHSGSSVSKITIDDLGMFRIMPNQKIILIDGNFIPIMEVNVTDLDYLNYFVEYINDETEEFFVNDTQYVCYPISFSGRKYHALSYGYDITGQAKFRVLKKTVTAMCSIGVILIFFIAYAYSGFLLRPIRNIIDQVKVISDQNLHLRLEAGTDKEDEMNQLAKTFNQMLERLEYSFLIEKKFVANTSHEYRTPLTAMKGQIEVAMMNERSNDYYVNLLKSISEDINRLISLQESLSSLMGSNLMHTRNEFKEITILDMISEARDYVIRANPNYSIRFIVNEYPEETQLTLVNGDSILLKSAIINLLDNACKFSHPNQCTIQLTFNHRKIIIEVIDSGVGIHPDAMPYIFDPFYRSKDKPSVEGFGIGLSLVKRIVDLHDGEIKVKSKTGVGSTFTVVLNSMFL